MSDKFRRVFPIKIEFVDGELPKAKKLNSLGSQTRNGLTLIEKAVGDIFNQSGDANLSPPGDLFENALFINSLGRALGGQNLISPRIPNLPDIEKYEDVIVTVGASPGQEGWLRYKPVPAGASLVAGDFTIVDAGSSLNTGGGSYQTSPEDVDSTGDWHITANGKLTAFTAFTSVTLIYKPVIQPDIDATAVFNVIPDPNTTGAPGTAFFGLKVAFANDLDNTLGYWIYLPPRRPLSRELINSPDETNNQDSTDVYFFQDPTVSATDTVHARYRYTPLIEGIITAAVGAGFSKPISDNYLYLYNRDTGTILDGIIFEADSAVGGSTWIVRASGAKLDQLVNDGDITIATKADETSSAYANELFIAQPGTSNAQIQAALLQQYKDHTHDNIDGSQPISHNDLQNLFEISSPAWGPSSLPSDDHPQYLHRDGYDGTTAGLGARDVYRGGMRGSLLLLSTSSTSDFFNTLADSRRIHFGDDTNALWHEQTENALSLLGLPRLYIKDPDAALQLEDKKFESQTGSDELFLSRGGNQSDTRLVVGTLTATSRTDEGAVAGGDERIDISAVAGSHGVVAAEGTAGARRLLLDGEDGVFIGDANADFLYFPTATTSFETDVFLSRGRVDALTNFVNQQKVYSTFWNHAGAVTTASATFVEIDRVTVTLTGGINYKLVINGWTNFSQSAANGRIGLRARIAGGTTGLVAIGTSLVITGTGGQADTISVSSAIFAGNVSGTFDVALEFQRQSGSGTIYAGTGELNVILAVDESV